MNIGRTKNSRQNLRANAKDIDRNYNADRNMQQKKKNAKLCRVIWKKNGK